MGIILKWSPRSASTSQKVYRSSQPFGADDLPAVLATVATDATEYDDTTTASGGVYYYAVQAVSGARTVLSATIRANSGISVPVDTNASLEFMDYVTSGGGVDTVSLDTGASASGAVEKYLLVVAGQYGTGIQPVVLATFDGRDIRELYQIKDSYDTISFGLVNVETGGAKDLVVNVVGSTVARQMACLYKVVNADESTVASASVVDSEAAFNLTAFDGGASVGVGLGENSSLASVGISGLSVEDVAPEKIDTGDFWCSVISETGLESGLSSLQLDADGSTSRALAAGFSIEKIADPVDAVSLTYVDSASESDTSKDLTIDTGAASGDKTYIIGFAGQFDGTPTLPIFDSVSCEILHTYKPAAYDFLQFVKCTITSGGVKTFSFTGGDTVYRKSIHVWEVENHREQDDYATRVAGEASFDITPPNGSAIVCIALGRGSVAGAGIVGLTSDYGPTLMEADFYVSASSDVFTSGSTQTINNDVNGTNTSRAIIMALMLSPT